MQISKSGKSYSPLELRAVSKAEFMADQLIFEFLFAGFWDGVRAIRVG